MDQECIKATHSAAKLCEELGHQVEEKAPIIDQEVLGPAVVKIINVSILGNIAHRLKELGRELLPEDVEKVTWRAAENGKTLSAADSSTRSRPFTGPEGRRRYF